MIFRGVNWHEKHDIQDSPLGLGVASPLDLFPDMRGR